MNIALIAHDQKKERMIAFAKEHQDVLRHHTLYATGTTGLKIIEATGLSIHRFQSGPLGGDQEIGALIAQQKMDMVFFFRDPLTSQPHEPDVSALLRLADVYDIPVATNIVSASIYIKAVREEDLG